MKTCLTFPLTVLLGLLCQAAGAQCLRTSSAMADAMTEPVSGLWLAALALMGGIAWRRQDH